MCNPGRRLSTAARQWGPVGWPASGPTLTITSFFSGFFRALRTMVCAA
ncbi:hypothetical protein SFUL_5499 [Streptomyces microflavus DSM 40593]|uniref:Uncharacterized protein n=1 Tax=Streptomyces microflavus DSM 40593 TaxID=1303692 RepID=N0D4Y4_STRMI|nr:hypothetical protein SFUL_5499 [Streptomyces microflavus DSM 40593]